jgi:hypothetical protein
MTALSVLDGGWAAPPGADAARLRAAARRATRGCATRPIRRRSTSARIGPQRQGRPPTRGRHGRVGQELRPWLNARAALPVGPLFCIIDGPTRGRP